MCRWRASRWRLGDKYEVCKKVRDERGVWGRFGEGGSSWGDGSSGGGDGGQEFRDAGTARAASKDQDEGSEARSRKQKKNDVTSRRLETTIGGLGAGGLGIPIWSGCTAAVLGRCRVQIRQFCRAKRSYVLMHVN